MPPHGLSGATVPDLAAQHAQLAGHGGPLFPFLGGLMFLLVLVLALVTLTHLHRTGRLGALPWARPSQSPEHEARTILATRFATGDLSSEEFLERASALNWTPGVEPAPASRRRARLGQLA